MATPRVRVVIDGLSRTVGDVVRDIALDVHARLQDATPVDTGWARSNWIPQIGTPFEGTAGTREDAEQGRIDSGSATAGRAEVSRYRLEQGDIHVSNEVPYIEKLNAGSSSQAPAAFVQAAAQRAVDAAGDR